MLKDGIRLIGRIKIEKFSPGVDPQSGKPYEVIESTNLFLTAGINEIWSLVTGASTNHFDNTSAQIGIGNDKTTAPAAGQTDLQGTQKTYKSMDAGYPTTPANGEVQFKATFGPNDANYEWGEFVIKHATSGICINRSTNNGNGWGTKNSGETWTVTAKLSIS